MCRSIQSNDSLHQLHAPTERCSCCRLHTKGDEEMAGFLKDEIVLEKKSKVEVSRVTGFSVKSTNGAEVVLQKQVENETITIRLNVNGTVDDEMNMDKGESKDQPEAKMVSRPPFVVEINKGGDSTLAIQCSFPVQDELIDTTSGEEQQYEDLIELQEVALLKGEKWQDTTYCAQGSMLDGNLYDMLLNMLEERGIDAQFIDQLVEFSTAYEHQNYINFLEGLKDFASCK